MAAAIVNLPALWRQPQVAKIEGPRSVRAEPPAKLARGSGEVPDMTPRHEGTAGLNLFPQAMRS